MENVCHFCDCIICIINDVTLLAQLIFSQIWEALRLLMKSEKGIIPRPVLIITDEEQQIFVLKPSYKILKAYFKLTAPK